MPSHAMTACFLDIRQRSEERLPRARRSRSRQLICGGLDGASLPAVIVDSTARAGYIRADGLLLCSTAFSHLSDCVINAHTRLGSISTSVTASQPTSRATALEHWRPSIPRSFHHLFVDIQIHIARPCGRRRAGQAKKLKRRPLHCRIHINFEAVGVALHHRLLHKSRKNCILWCRW